MRTVEYPEAVPASTNDGIYASVSGTWPVNQRTSVTLTLQQDFSTSSSNFQTSTASADLMAMFAHTSKLSSNASLGAGMTEFLSGFAPSTGAPTTGFNGEDRSDFYITAGCGAAYTINEHYTVSLSYTYFQNSSNLANFEFSRHSVSASISARW
jgi:opacity protein-like surface antigen